MASNKFITDGDALVKEAEKHLKTGLTKWNADYDLAANCFTKAATSFKNGKDAAKCLDCWMKSADCHLKNKVPFQAAKSYEQAAFAARDLGDAQKIPDLLNKAYLLYVENGTQDTAGTLLDRGAKMLEDQLPEQAVALYRKAGDLALIHDKTSQASEMFERAARLLVKIEKYSEAARVLEELLQNEAGSPTPLGRRYALCLVLVYLKLDDYVAGKKAYEIGLSLPDPSNSGQLALGKSLLDSYDTGDRESFKAVTSNAFIRSMDPVYARLARSIDVPDGGFENESGHGAGDGNGSNSSSKTPREFQSTPSPSDTGRDRNENRSVTQDDDDLT